MTEKEAKVAEAYRRLRDAGENYGGPAIAEALGISRDAARSALKRLRKNGELEDRDRGSNRPVRQRPLSTLAAGFSVAPIPSELPTVEELITRRKQEFERKNAHQEAVKLINVDIHMDGPIGIVHMGDPHVDDSGADIAAIERDIEIINRTPGMLGANVGDNNNNWVGRLVQLYGQQETTAAEAWLLTEWLVKSVPWLYLLAGNHGCWSGAGDPLQWMISHAGVFAKWGARLNLRFPNGKEVRINARHDFKGTSMWNPAHGPMKAIQGGWRDHLLSCGHLHVSGHGVLKDPATGLISHAIRVAGYKKWDSYATELGLPDQSISPSVTTIIDPRFDDDDPRLITVLLHTETAADYLTFLRARN